MLLRTFLEFNIIFKFLVLAHSTVQYYQQVKSTFGDINQCITIKGNQESATQCILKCRRKNLQGFMKKVNEHDKEVEETCYCCPGQGVTPEHNAESEFQTFTEIKNDEIGGSGKENDPAQSCKRLKDDYPHLSSGMYWLKLDKPTQVYCEMNEVNGGWMLIGNLTITADNISLTPFDYYYLQSPEGDNFKGLSSAINGAYFLNLNKFRMLQTYTKFSEVRIYCYKEWHGRNIHGIIKASGDEILYLSGEKSRTYFYNCQGTFEFLSTDTSIIQHADCGQISLGSNLYLEIVWQHSLSHIRSTVGNGNARFECDDYFASDSGFNSKGTWRYFVR